MSFMVHRAVRRPQFYVKSLSTLLPACALTLVSFVATLGITGCGLDNGRQHGLGAGIYSGPTPTPPPAGTVYTPVGIASAVNSTTNMLYVVNSGAAQNSPTGTLYAISGVSNSLVATLPGLAKPVAVDVNNQTNTIYVANSGNDTVSVVSGASNTVTTTIPVGNYPSAIAVNPTTNMVYVDNFNDGTVSVINGATNAVVATVSSLGTGINLIAVDSGINQIYIGSNQGYAEAVTILNGATNFVLQTLNLKNAPQALAVNPATQTLYAESNETTVTGVVSSSQIDVFDEATTTILGRVVLPGFVNSPGMAVNPSTSMVYAANNTNSVLNVINQFSSVAAVPYTTTGATVDSVSVNPATNRIDCVYTADNGSNLGVQVINGQTNTTVATVPLP